MMCHLCAIIYCDYASMITRLSSPRSRAQVVNNERIFYGAYIDHTRYYMVVSVGRTCAYDVSVFFGHAYHAIKIVCVW